MYSRLQYALKYFRYYQNASNAKGHGTHSPFVFDFITKVLNDRARYAAYKKVESLKKALLKDETILTVEDLGAGSFITESNKRSVKSIARTAAKPTKFGRLLHRIVKYYQPGTIIELGTSLGLSTAYMSLAMPAASIVTLEGSRQIAAKARANFQQLGIEHIQLVEGDFDNTLMPVLEEAGKADLVFIDGNHRLGPTLRYFEQILPFTHNNSVLIFDDIHWSEEMEKAWESIKSHPSVRCSIDLFFLGVVFFRREFHEKQHFSIRY